MGQAGVPPQPFWTWERVRNWLIDFIVSLPFMLALAFIFERLGSAESVRVAETLQQHFDAAISAFDPKQIFLYVGDAFEYVIRLLANTLMLIVSEDTAASILSIAKFLIYPACGALVIAALPFVILIESVKEGHGHLFEGVLSVGCWLVVVLIARSTNKKSKTRAQGFSFPFVESVLVTFGFLWFVKLTMITVDDLLWRYLALCRMCASASAIASSIYWCTKKTAEYSVTETTLSWAKHFVLNSTRHVG